ncbi:MAG: NAD(P)-dependent oxidoreductase [Marinoscillum sp.]|uniref:SDR family oxidoreductase n=1 Tax=Marinoscillum sp. TaxID=2024838 RepID=UPI0033003474
MRVLVTGANGLLGQKLISLLSGMPDITTIATGRGPNRNPTGSYSYLSADLSSQKEVQKLIQDAHPEAIIHCGAMTQVDDCELHPEACWQANVNATAYLLAAAQTVNAYFSYVSTDFVFDGENGPYEEDDLPNPISHYGRSKLEAELLVSRSGLTTSIVRTVLVYGVAHDLSRSNIVLWVKKNLEQQKSIKVVNDQWRTPTLAEDLALGCWLITKNQHQGVFHISGEEMLTPYSLALQVADFFGLDPSLICPVDASTFTQPGKRPPRTGFLIEKAKGIGFQPRSITEGLAIVKSQLS